MPDSAHQEHTTHTMETMTEVLQALLGKVVTVANSESYEDAPVGHRLTTGFYKAKIVHIAEDHIVLVTEFKHIRNNLPDEPAKQFVPILRVKRISVMKSEKIIHI